MSVATILSGLFAPLAGLGSEWLKSRRMHKAANLAIKRIELEGKIAAAKSLNATTANYDTLAQQQMAASWKDEYLVLLFSIPLVVSFLTPYLEVILSLLYVTEYTLADVELTETLAASWELVGSAPSWYQWVLMGIVTATFGLRWAAGRGLTFKESK